MLSGLLAACPAASLVTTAFDTSAQGWLVTGDNASLWSASEGDPGRCFDVNDLATGDENLAIAPPAYLGDWSAMTSADSISLDQFLQRLSGGAFSPPHLFRISGPGGAAHTMPGSVPPLGVWTTVGARLDSTTWVIESGSWSAILAHVDTAVIQASRVALDRVL